MVCCRGSVELRICLDSLQELFIQIFFWGGDPIMCLAARMTKYFCRVLFVSPENMLLLRIMLNVVPNWLVMMSFLTGATEWKQYLQTKIASHATCSTVVFNFTAIFEVLIH